jgi:hypothetical protein
VDSGQHRHGARDPGIHRTIEQILAHQNLTSADRGERRRLVEPVRDYREQCDDHETHAIAKRSGKHGAECRG